MLFKNELILNGKYGLNGLPCHDNATSSYRRGIEMEFDWNFISKFNLRSSASYSNNRISTDTYGNKNHILTPDVTFDGDLYYNNNKFNLGLNANYRSSMYINLDNTKSIPYLFTLNAYGSYKHNDLELGIRYNNITNRINYNNGVIGANDKILYFRNAPTNFNVFVRYTL
jgi:iron complex outermembrane receptor protein